MLEIKELTIKTLKGEKEIINNLNLSIDKNDKIAIIGGRRKWKIYFIKMYI